jgi:hypothetical protein
MPVSEVDSRRWVSSADSPAGAVLVRVSLRVALALLASGGNYDLSDSA